VVPSCNSMDSAPAVVQGRHSRMNNLSFCTAPN